MSVALPNPRLLALAGLAVAALVAFVVARPLIFGQDATDTTPATQSPSTPAPSTKSPNATSKPSVPRVQLVPGLPGPLARELRYEKVVVVAVYSDKAPSDRTALTQARDGAREVDAGFVALNVLNERRARSFAKFVGVSETPAMLVVRRPGNVVTRIDGFVDSAIVAQAAHNAGAGKNASK